MLGAYRAPNGFTIKQSMHGYRGEKATKKQIIIIDIQSGG